MTRLPRSRREIEADLGIGGWQIDRDASKEIGRKSPVDRAGPAMRITVEPVDNGWATAYPGFHPFTDPLPSNSG